MKLFRQRFSTSSLLEAPELRQAMVPLPLKRLGVKLSLLLERGPP